VLGLSVVLPDGRLIRTGHRTVKGVTGYDLTALLVGSEGTLGVIVGATVKVVPLPQGETVTIGALFTGVAEAAAASARITAARLRPAVMELMDAPSLSAISAYLGAAAIQDAFGLSQDAAELGAAYLLVQFDGPSSRSEAENAIQVITEAGGTARLSADAAEGERLLAIRRSFHPALEAGGTVLIEDVSVPRSAMPAMFAAIAAISAKYGILIPTVAHAGDGNLHPNFVYSGDEVPDHVWAAADELFRTALGLGGTLTGEHGIGVLKRRWLKDEVGPDSLDLQIAIKSVFDPLGIMNPGKVF
jgi:glycolate oxidase